VYDTCNSSKPTFKTAKRNYKFFPSPMAVLTRIYLYKKSIYKFITIILLEFISLRLYAVELMTLIH